MNDAELLSFRAYNPVIRNYQSVFERLIKDPGPPRRAKVVFANKRVMHIEYTPEFLKDVRECLSKMIIREKKSRGLEN